jgi:hypothetical protein
LRYATTQPGESVTELAGRLFDAETRADLDAAKEALVEANPQIEGRRKLDAGMVVEVPEVAEAEPTSVAGPPTDVAPAVALNGLRTALPGFFDAIRTAADERVAGAERETKSLRSAGAKRAARRTKKAADGIRRARDGADYRLAEARALRTEHKAALRDIESDLDDLLSLFGS